MCWRRKVLFVAMLASLVAAQTGFTIGNRVPKDEIIYHQEEASRFSLDYLHSFFKTYPGDNYHVISMVVCDDLSDHKRVLAALVAGGPGHTYVTIAYTLPRLTNIRFNVTMYGRPPIFRKIP